MKKAFIFFIIPFLLIGCSNKKTPTNVNEVLMSIKNYTCVVQIENYSNKNTITYTANQTYKHPDTYLMTFNDNEQTIISYNIGTLSITSNKLNILKKFENYQNINQNPLFLSYFLNTYFNTSPQNIITNSLDEISINLPSNNAYLHKATLKLKNQIPASITYYDRNGDIKVNIIYNEFKSESL